MKTTITTIAAILLIASTTSYAYADVPDWIKNNAGWWAEGSIDDESFVGGIQFLIQENILQVPTTSVASEASNSIPDWIKNNAGWWSAGTINDDAFVSAIQYLVEQGILDV